MVHTEDNLEWSCNDIRTKPSFCMRKKTKKHKSSSSTTSVGHHHARKLFKDKQSSHRKKDPIKDDEKEMCHDVIQTYLKPKMKSLLISMINISIQHQYSTLSVVTLKSGKEIIVDKKYANQLLNLNLCSEINPNSSQLINEKDSKSLADELIESFEYDIINHCINKSQRWEKLLSFWSFLQYLKTHVPQISEDDNNENGAEIINKEPEQQQTPIETPQIEPEAAETTPKEMTPPEIEEHPVMIPQFSKTRTDNIPNVVQQPLPETTDVRRTSFGEPPGLALDRRKSYGFIKQIQSLKKRSPTTKRQSDQGTGNDKIYSHSSKRYSDPRSPIRQLDKVWSDYDNVHIPERDKEQ